MSGSQSSELRYRGKEGETLAEREQSELRQRAGAFGDGQGSPEGLRTKLGESLNTIQEVRYSLARRPPHLPLRRFRR